MHGGTPSAPEAWTEQGRPTRRRRGVWALAVVAVLAVIGAAVAVGVVVDERRDAAAARAAEAAAARAEAEAERQEELERERVEAAELAARKAEHAACTGALGRLLRALDEVDARLNVGLNQDEYSRLVGDASVAYNRIDVASLGQGDCLSAGAALEGALNDYSAVASRWDECIYDFYCDIDSIDPMMQRNWAAATRAIAKASRLIDGLDPSKDAGSGEVA